MSQFKSIVPGKSYAALDVFTDENGNIDTKMGQAMWTNTFSEENGVTTVVSFIAFEKEDDMKEMLKMGFEEGYKMGLGQLQEIL